MSEYRKLKWSEYIAICERCGRKLKCPENIVWVEKDGRTVAYGKWCWERICNGKDKKTESEKKKVSSVLTIDKILEQ